MRVHLRVALAIAFLALLSALPSLAAAEDAASVSAAPGALGVGVVLGSPTGLSVKMKLDPHNSIDGALGVGFASSLHVHIDYLWEGGELMRQEGGELSWFIGAGGRLEIDDNDRGRDVQNDDKLSLGGRAPIGLEIVFDQVPKLELFGEVALGVEIVEDVGLTLDAGIGARWFF